MRRVIFVSQRLYGYTDEIIKVMKEKLGYEVLFIENNYGYKNIWEKLLGNLIYKPILKKNYKTEKYCNEAIKKIEQFGEFDEVFFINPEESSDKLIKYLSKKIKPMRAHLWDSLKFMKDVKDYIGYFSYKTSFDSEDCKKHDMKFLPNFYIERLLNQQNKKYDFFSIMMYDERFERLEKLAKKLKAYDKKYLFLVLDKKNSVKSDYITIIDTPISIENVYKYMGESKGIVELGREHRDNHGNRIYQGGLTFRAIESLGNESKLITDYDLIKNYDFYKPKNTFIIPKEVEYEIDNQFLEEDYENIEEEIRKKYSCESWVRNIFEEENNV